jgi:iron complex outermembrane receptor protein
MPDIAPPGRRIQGTHFVHQPDKTRAGKPNCRRRSVHPHPTTLQNIMNFHPEKDGLRNHGLAMKRSAALTLLAAILAAALHAADPAQPGPNLGDLSIEQLMNESVTSVSKQEQKLGDAAAAISVLSNDDLQRSGATTIMEALRLVPGLDVGQVDSSRWAVSARGFNSVFSNKLLVLIDGRAVYSPLFAGVFWDVQQVMLADVDRIEVIRGPGATVWGANAVNGVINVVSRSARDTQGGLLYGGGGDQHELLGGVRYGGQISPDTYYRVFASDVKDTDFPLAGGAPAHDGWEGRHGGFRVDHYPAAGTQLTWQADATDVKLNDGSSRSYDLNSLGRWTRQLSDRSGVEVQAYYDRVFRDESAEAKASSDTFDLSAQHTFGLGASHSLIWGGGYRYIDNELAPTTPFVQVRHARSRQQLFSTFLQDEYQLIPDRLTFTAGGKIEHNSYTGWEFQPSIRAVFKPTPKSTVWAAMSRAVRTPSAVEGKDVLGITAGAPFTGPGGGTYLPVIVGNAHPASEVLLAYEAGYRVQASRHVSVDLALFYNDYSQLIGVSEVPRFVPGTPLGTAEIPLDNLLGGETHGGEASLTVTPVAAWRLTASYSRLTIRLHGAAVLDPASSPSSPRNQAVLRSSHDFTRRISLDVQLRYVSALPTVAAYTTADFRLAFRWTDRLELALVGQDLFTPQHPEVGLQQATVTTDVPREFYSKATWRF